MLYYYLIFNCYYIRVVSTIARLRFWIPSILSIYTSFNVPRMHVHDCIHCKSWLTGVAAALEGNGGFVPLKKFN